MEHLIKNWKVAAAVIAVIAAAYIISAYFFQVMMIHGDSMYPTLKSMHFALIDKRAEDFDRGDVIVFRSRKLRSMLVKRVVAIPGDSVKIADGKLYVNGGESDLYRDLEIDDPGALSEETVLGLDEFAVLGDNLSHSKDSRHEEVGLVKRQDISGKVIM